VVSLLKTPLLNWLGWPVSDDAVSSVCTFKTTKPKSKVLPNYVPYDWNRIASQYLKIVHSAVYVVEGFVVNESGGGVRFTQSPSFSFAWSWQFVVVVQTSRNSDCVDPEDSGVHGMLVKTVLVSRVAISFHLRTP
jgi:hypothetical protein